MASLLGAFNAQIVKFIEDIATVLKPEDAAEARKSVSALKLTLRMSPTSGIKVWQGYARMYATEIAAGDMEAFIDRDYSNVLQERGSSWLDACERIRTCAKYLSPSNQKKTMDYVQLLTKLSNMYGAS
jgi:hypothetical protein